MDAGQFIDIVAPNHDKEDCHDYDIKNGFKNINGNIFIGQCKRCMYLEISSDILTEEELEIIRRHTNGY